MKIENGKLVYELKTCWDCDGGKRVIRHKLCPNNWKPVRKHGRKVCEHCGAKNRHDHKTVGQYETDCSTCNATGQLMEDRFSRLPVRIFNQFEFIVLDKKYKTNFSDSYLGIGLVGGATDYGRMWNFAKTHSHNEIIEVIKKEYAEHGDRQALNFLMDGKTETVVSKIGIAIGETGYAVRPIRDDQKEFQVMP